MQKCCFPWASGSRLQLRSAEIRAGNSAFTAKRRAIEAHWAAAVAQEPRHEAAGPSTATQTAGPSSRKCSVVPMFPYPSGSLHLGHVRVYALSDAIARFRRLRGEDVVHPIGWDAFGLPAENAALQRGLDPAAWTTDNVAQMRGQLEGLGCRWDWERELSTADPAYYRWTQWLFVRLWRAGLVRWGRSRVHWDPVDRTVVADEQLDAEGRAWRSGAKAELRLLPQWAVRITRHAKALRDSLRPEWGETAKVQQEWIGPCDVHRFHLPLRSAPDHSPIPETLDFGLVDPEELPRARKVHVQSTHFLATLSQVPGEASHFEAYNPCSGDWMPVEVSDSAPYGQDLDTALELGPPREGVEWSGKRVLEAAEAGGWGGYLGSRRLRDWFVSRQRYWGTPIPVVHCASCGPQALPEDRLPLVLPHMSEIRPSGEMRGPLAGNAEWMCCDCPKCGGAAQREPDTLDTLMDSSWYFLRYADPHNAEAPFDRALVDAFLPLDVYLGGVEHAGLHLFYARFVHHFLHSVEGRLSSPDPFRRLLTQGVVKGLTRVHSASGQFLGEDEVKKAPDGALLAKEDGAAVELRFEKMSKSKFNGVEPADAIAEMGIDALRLTLFRWPPRVEVNWEGTRGREAIESEFWLWRLWNLVQRLLSHQASEGGPASKASAQLEAELRLARDQTSRKAVKHLDDDFNFARYIFSLEKFAERLNGCEREEAAGSEEWAAGVRALVVMAYPLVPHLAAELWAAAAAEAAGPVWAQRWPEADAASLGFLRIVLLQRPFKARTAKLKLAADQLARLKEGAALDLAFAHGDLRHFFLGHTLLHAELTRKTDHEHFLVITLEPLTTFF